MLTLEERKKLADYWAHGLQLVNVTSILTRDARGTLRKKAKEEQ